MKNKLPKHNVHTLSDGSLVIYLPGKLLYFTSLRDICDHLPSEKIAAWVMAPRYWRINVDIALCGDSIIKQQGYWRYRNRPVYRGKLKTRIKQLEEEIKHKQQMKANTALDPMNTITVGDDEKKFVSSDDETTFALTEEDFKKITPATNAIYYPSKPTSDGEHQTLFKTYLDYAAKRKASELEKTSFRELAFGVVIGAVFTYLILTLLIISIS